MTYFIEQFIMFMSFGPLIYLFPIFWLWVDMMKGITKTRREDYIRYLCFYYYQWWTFNCKADLLVDY